MIVKICEIAQFTKATPLVYNKIMFTEIVYLFIIVCDVYPKRRPSIFHPLLTGSTISPSYYSLHISDQIDLWTFNSTGCPCPPSTADQAATTAAGGTCPCCVSNGCPCVTASQTTSRSNGRCGQCGLERFCDNSKLLAL